MFHPKTHTLTLIRLYARELTMFGEKIGEETFNKLYYPGAFRFKINRITGKLGRAMPIKYKHKKFRVDKEKMIKFRLISHNAREFLPLLKDCLEEAKGVCLTHPTGSFAPRKVRKLNDADIAVLLNEKLEV